MRRTVLLLAHASCVGGAFAGKIPCDKWLGPGGRYSGHYDIDTDLRDHLEQLRLRAKQGSRKDPRIDLRVRLWERAVVDTYDLKRITADHCGAFAGFSRIDQCAGFVVCELCVGARLQSASWKFRKGLRVACWKKVERCFFAEAEQRRSGAYGHCARKFYTIPRDLSANECHFYDSGFSDLQERLALEFYKAAVGVDERIKRQVVEGHKRGFEDPNEAFWCGGDALYTGAPATIPDRRRHEGHALPGILKLAVTVLCCLLILGHFDRRRRRQPRTAPQDDDDSDGDFEPGPRTTTASARRRSPRLVRR